MKGHRPWRNSITERVPGDVHLLEFPVAHLCDGSQMPLTGAYGFRTDVESRVDQIAQRLDTPADQA